MKLLFNIKVNKENLFEFKNSYFKGGDRAYLQNNIGLSRFWLLDELGNLIKEFDDLLFDTVINFALSYNSLIKGTATQGGLFVMEPEWEMHLWFELEGNNFRISFKNHRDIVMSKKDFRDMILNFSNYALSSIECFYEGIVENEHYINYKREIYQNLND